MKSILPLVFAALLSSNVAATTLNTTIHADNEFNAYLSTSDSVPGTQFSAGVDWSHGTVGSATLAAGQNYYLHIFVRDVGEIAGLLASLTLDSTDHQFANASQSLLTNTSDWQGNTVGFNGSYGPLNDIGGNGVSPWGFQGDVGSGARWIWAGDRYSNNATYFTTAITATTSAVPEPGSLALLGLGLAGFAALRRRK